MAVTFTYQGKDEDEHLWHADVAAHEHGPQSELDQFVFEVVSAVRRVFPELEPATVALAQITHTHYSFNRITGLAKEEPICMTVVEVRIPEAKQHDLMQFLQACLRA